MSIKKQNVENEKLKKMIKIEKDKKTVERMKK